MAARAEKEFPVGGAEWFIVGPNGYGVGRGFLFRKRNMIFHAKEGFENVSLFGDFIPEVGEVLGRDGKMELYIPLLVGSLKCTFYHMFLGRRTAPFPITVEQQ